MKYLGSKRRIAKYILPIILDGRKEDQWYVEPFCGGCNSLDKVGGKRIGADVNKYLIALLKEMQKDDFSAPFIGEDEYKKIKENIGAYPDWIVGYAGFQLSFGAKWFGGYRRDKKGVRNYENEAQQNLKAQQNLIKGVEFYCCGYDQLKIPANSIVYCDPPYRNTTKYGKQTFDHDKFFSWCREIGRNGNAVFVSEYDAPKDFICVWEKQVSVGLDVASVKKETEKLFTLPQ